VQHRHNNAARRILFRFIGGLCAGLYTQTAPSGSIGLPEFDYSMRKAHMGSMEDAR